MARHPLTALCVLLVLLLAGCSKQGSPDETPGVVPPTPDSLTFLDPVAVTGASVGEPGILLQNGTLWVHAPGGLWKSTDGGLTWTDATPTGGVILGGDADLAIGADGSLYWTDLLNLASISVFSSHDGGASWFFQPLASDYPGDDRQWIATGPDAGPLGSGEAVYLAYNHLASNVVVTKSTDGGMTFVGRTAVLRPQTEFWSMGNLLVDAKGTVYAVYSLGNALKPYGDDALPTVDFSVQVVVSKDGGLTWTEHQVVDSEGSPGEIFPVIALDDAGNLYATWAENMGDHIEVKYATSRDQGTTWSAPVVVQQWHGTGVMPWVDASSPGHVAIAFYWANETAISDDVQGDWTLHLATTTNGLDAAPAWTETQVWDQPVLVGGLCTTGITCGLPNGGQGSRDLLDFHQVRIDEHGYPNFAFAKASGGGTQTYYTRQLTGPTL